MYTPGHYKDTGILPNSLAGEEGKLLRDFTMAPMLTLKQSLISVIG
jgi:hypothetical protein